MRHNDEFEEMWQDLLMADFKV